MAAYVVPSSGSSVVTGITLGSGDTLAVGSGGTVVSTSVSDGGAATVFFGGTDIDTTIGNGGNLYDFGGTTLNVTVNSGGSDLVDGGGSESGSTLNAGGQEVVLDGSVNSVTINSGGRQAVSSGGAAFNANVSSGGFEVVSSGAVLNGATFSQGAYLLSLPGSEISNLTIENGAIVASSGVLLYTPNNGVSIVSSLMEESLTSGDHTYALKNGVVSATTIDQSVITEAFGGLGVDNQFLHSSFEVVLDGGVASRSTISGSEQDVQVGGQAVSAFIYSGGFQYVSSGGEVKQTTLVSGGSQVIESGGTVSGTVVSSFGVEVVENGGSAIGTVVESDGVAFVLSGGEFVDASLEPDSAVVLTYLTYTSDTTINFDYSTDILTVNSGASSATLQLSGDYSGIDFEADAPDAGQGVVISAVQVSCFASGTRIMTDRGEVPVEHLKIGQNVMLAEGKSRPVVWIGRRYIDLTRHPYPTRVLPVKVNAHAFGQNLPASDVLLSPDHAIYAEDVLIPIRCLVNDFNVKQISLSKIVYYHVELDEHSIVYANGLPCESYLNTDDRTSFEDGGDATALYPSFGSERGDISLMMDALGFAPLRLTGEEVTRTKLLLAKSHEAQCKTDVPLFDRLHA